MSSAVQRKLTTILAADADGYSRVMEADEVGALKSLRAAREVFSKLIDRHHGRIANTAGDGLIAEFPSVVEAVQCAIEVQQELSATASEKDLRFRIGVHLGDVIVDGEDLLGEGVNLAARLQSMAEPGGILISRQVYDQVQKKLSVGFSYLGEKRPKNFSESVAVYSVDAPEPAGANGGRSEAKAAAPPTPERAKAAVDLRQRLVHQAVLSGAIFGVLLALDLMSGGRFWSLWAGLALALALGLRAAPLLARGWFTASYVRAGVVVVFLALVNALAGGGRIWFVWPAGLIVLIFLLRRLRAGPG
jgi:adenylate cyclase